MVNWFGTTPVLVNSRHVDRMPDTVILKLYIKSRGLPYIAEYRRVN